MDPENLVPPVISDSSTSPTRRSLLALLGLGALAGGLTGLVTPESTDAKKKRKKKKKKKGGKGGGGNNRCNGSVNGSASAAEETELLGRINQFRTDNGNLPPL